MVGLYVTLRNTTIRKRALHFFVYIWSVPIRFAVVLATPFQVSYCLLLAVSLYSVMIYFSTIQALGEVRKTEPTTNILLVMFFI